MAKSIKYFLKKLVLGKPSQVTKQTQNAFEKRINNIKSIWNNDHHDDIGIEKILRLVLALSQFLFPGTYLKQLFGKKGIEYRDLAMDVYILFKVIFPLIIIYNHLETNNILFYIMIWFLFETLLNDQRQR